MQTILRLFLRLINLPGQISFNTALHVTAIIAGFCVLYLLTLKKDEEGKVEDYIRRLWKRIENRRAMSISRHLAVIRVTAGAITSITDILFGVKLFSTQALGVSASLALVCLNSYMFVSSIKRHEANWDNLFNTSVFLSFALFPAVVTVYRTSKPYYRRPKRPFKQTWRYVWAILLLVFIARQYLSPFTCTSCVPTQYQGFFFSAMLMLTAIAIVGAVLFTSFVLVTRFSLKGLSVATSTGKSIVLLLIGCAPIPVFWALLKICVFLVNHTKFTERGPSDPIQTFHMTAQEWVAIGSLVVFSLSFFINVAFLLGPALFFAMAALLLVHRLLWLILEQPLQRLSRTGIFKYQRTIAVIGLVMLCFGIGKLEWLEKLVTLFK
jgi:hypothetical protein